MSSIAIIRAPIARTGLQQYVLGGSGLVKAVVDCGRDVMAVGGELHADEEQVLLQDGSKQENLWGINLHLDESSDRWIEFDSMINIRPLQDNRSRGVEDPVRRESIVAVVSRLVQ